MQDHLDPILAHQAYVYPLSSHVSVWQEIGLIVFVSCILATFRSRHTHLICIFFLRLTCFTVLLSCKFGGFQFLKQLFYTYCIIQLNIGYVHFAYRSAYILQSHSASSLYASSDNCVDIGLYSNSRPIQLHYSGLLGYRYSRTHLQSKTILLRLYTMHTLKVCIVQA